MSSGTLFRSRDGTVEVRESGRSRPVRALAVDGVVQGDDSPRGVVMESRLGLLPALLVPEGASGGALVIGVGTGITLGALAAALGARAVTAAERNPAVLEALPMFRGCWARPIDREPVTLCAADGRDLLAEAREPLGLILCDLILPSAGADLFTRTFYERCAVHLAPEGLCAQWVPLFQIPPRMFRRVVAAFLEVFPRASMWLAAFETFKPVALLASSGGRDLGVAPVANNRRCRREALAAVPAAGLPTVECVRSLFVLDAAGLARLSGDSRPFDGGEPLVADAEAQDGLPSAGPARTGPPARPEWTGPDSEISNLKSQISDLEPKMSLGLADGGEANLAAVLQASDAVDPTGAALLEACRLDDAGAWAGALARYRDVMQAWPDDPLVRLRAAEASCSLLLTHGLDLWSAGDCPAAEAAIRQALAASPDRADARETLAKLLTTLGRHREALAEIESALAVDPGDPDLLTGRRAILHNLARTAR